MALVVKDRVKEITTTTGTSNLTLGGAVFGFQSFSVVGNGNQTYYAIYDSATGDWEVGVGTYSTTGPTLSRDTVLESSNSGSKVVLAAGTKDVFLTYPAERSVYLDTAGSAVTVLDIGTLGTSTANITTANITAGTISTTPTSSNDLVNKTYVDGIAAQGITYHTPVKYEVPNTTGNLNATYNNGASGVGATLTNAGTLAAFAPDGPTAQIGDRILVYNQTNAAHNGVYTVTTVGSGSVAWVLTRAADANTYGLKDPNALGSGDAFFVTSGNTGAGETYVCNTTGTITFGTTAITFAQIASAQIYSAGAGLTLSNLVFSLTPVGTAGTYGSASSVPVFTTNAYGQITSTTNTAISISAGAVSGLAPSATTDTTNASNITSGTLPVARLSGSYTGITGVGTLAAGTWNASTIGATFGGTGLTTYAQGDLLYATSSTTLGRLADVATGNALISGGVGADPSWGKIGLQTHVSGTLQVANGGTGATTLTGYVYGNGTGAFTASTSIPNSATTATSANTASAIVARDASGNFSAGTITASLSGNASTATSATSATTATNLAGGVAGAIPYQSAGGTTAFSAAGTSGQYLQSNGTTAPTWVTPPTIGNGTLTMAVSGTGLSGSATFTANQSGNSTFTVTSNATNANTASTIVARDASGNFSAGTITASLSGNATNVTGTVAVANGGTGATAAAGARTNLGATTLGANLFTITNPSAVTFPRFNADNTVSALDAATFRTAIGAGTGGGSVTSVSGTGTVNGLTLSGTVTSSGSLTLSGAISGVPNTATTATSANTASAIVARDASGNFSAGTITATLSGNASSASTSTTQAKTDASTNIATTSFSKWLFATSSTGGTLDWNDSSNTIPGVGVSLLLGSATNGPGGGNYYHPFNIEYAGNTGTGNVTQMAVAYGTPGNELYMRGRYNGSWTSWVRFLNSSNYNSYAPTLTGGGASGTWGINITGNAATATTAANVNNGTLTMNVSGTGLSGSQTFTANQAGNATFTVTSNATNANTASTIVARDGSGNFSAGTITAALSGNASTATSATTATNWGSYGAVPAAGTSFGNANTIGRSDANGYTYFNYINSNTGNSENPSVSQVIVTNGGDNFYRKASIAHLTSSLSGTAPINVSGNAATATNASYAFNYTQGFNSNWNTDFQAAPAGSTILRGDTLTGSSTGGPGGSWWFQQNMRHTNASNFWGTQVAWGWEDNANRLATRNVQNGSYGSWVYYLNSSNFTSYAPSLTGSGASGTWGINITGNAGNTSSISNAVGGTYTWTVKQYFTGNGNTASASDVGAQAYSTGGNGAIMAFHRAGSYAINMGLDSDNVFRLGGWSASANRLQMDMSGNLTMAGNVTAYSDERLKKDWAPVKEGFIEELASIKSGTYTRIDSDERQAGASAQDWEKLLPEVVSADNEGTLALAYGNAAVVACIELAKEVVALRAEIQALKASKE